jgi:HEPN domain-containing protein
MSDPAIELAREWLVRAEHDLRAAQYLLTMPEAYPETIGFHAQQCAEKALKGFLTFHRVPFERRHDLSYLIDLCVPLAPDFEQHRPEADEMTPYAVEYRYPDDLSSTSLDSARQATQSAGRLYAQVMARLGWASGAPRSF